MYFLHLSFVQDFIVTVCTVTQNIIVVRVDRQRIAAAFSTVRWEGARTRS